MKWNKEPDPKDNQKRIRNRFALFPTPVIVLSPEDNPLKVFQYPQKHYHSPSTKYVWLESYQTLERYNYLGTSDRSYWYREVDFIVEENQK